MEESIQNKINQLKADVYELIKQQETLTFQNNQIQEQKLKKVHEINALESLHKNDKDKGMDINNE